MAAFAHNLASKAVMTFTQLRDESKHREHNAWHQLDHLPENRALASVAHGERWVHTPACRATRTYASTTFTELHYGSMYLFRTPVDASLSEFYELYERARQWGRLPYPRWASQPLAGVFDIVQGYRAPTSVVSLEALPHRPKTGVFVKISELADPYGTSGHDSFARHDQVWMPQVLARPGVLGGWLLAGTAPDVRTTWGTSGTIRISLLYLDAPIDQFGMTLLDDPLPPAVSCGDDERLLFSGCLETIAPWEWDWFETA
jgi:hypothetical protein